MPRGRHGHCQRHKGPCTCEMGNMYRFVEPIVLLSLARLGYAHGYQIAQYAEDMAITDTPLDVSAIYRTLRKFEEAGFAESSWDTSGKGPAKRVYKLTNLGWQHLHDWNYVLTDVISSLKQLNKACSETLEENKELFEDK